MDKRKTYLVVGLGLLGGKYALELSRTGYRVLGINRSQSNLDWALEQGYVAEGKTRDFADLIGQADRSGDTADGDVDVTADEIVAGAGATAVGDDVGVDAGGLNEDLRGDVGGR